MPASLRGDSFLRAEVFPAIITCNADTCLCLILWATFSTNDKVAYNITPNICCYVLPAGFFSVAIDASETGHKCSESHGTEKLAEKNILFFPYWKGCVICFVKRSVMLRCCRCPEVVQPSMFFLPLIITLGIKEGNCLVYYISFNSSNSSSLKVWGSNGHLMAVKHVSCLYLVGREREWCTSLDLFQPQSTAILRSAVQNDLMLRNWWVSRIIAEPPWQHFLHGDNAALLLFPPSLPLHGNNSQRARNVFVPFSSGWRCRCISSPSEITVVLNVINWIFTAATVKSFIVPPVTSFSPKQPSGMLQIVQRKLFFSGVNGCVNNVSQAGCYRDSSVRGTQSRSLL